MPNLLRMPFACVGLDWARPHRPSGFGLPLPLIALIKWCWDKELMHG